MKRTISVMVGKGSVNHNSRKFHAANTDPERSKLNRSYCNENIKTVYRELFSKSVKQYNEKQTRSDRIIKDYYEKIRSGKQEKPFHEIILQIGNRGDMDATSLDGEIAAAVLDEYYKDFQRRNPNMRVFSAHLHMDEATPHLHIDFIPFTTNSKRGLETRISLKQALAAQGFNGGSRRETEWNQWVQSEKEALATVMARYDIEWEQKGTHAKHLSVLEFEKKMRAEEVTQLESRIEELQKCEDLIGLSMDKYDNDPEWQLPEPARLMSANTYKIKIVNPFIKKLKEIVRSIVAQYLDLKASVKDLKSRLLQAYSENNRLMDRIGETQKENKQLSELARDYKHVRKSIGEKQVDAIISRTKAEERAVKRPIRSKNNYER
ncbi:MAG: plasmid recombination protein [Christensenellales bacterium]|jgi:hypothetical protein